MNNDNQARNAIIAAVQANQPSSLPMPKIPRFSPTPSDDLVENFGKGLTRMAGSIISETVPDLDKFIRDRFPEARVICSTVPECTGTIRPEDLTQWSGAASIDVSVVRSPLGVAETGSVLLSDLELRVNTIAFLSHDIVVLLDPSQIVPNIHDAYAHPYFATRPYCVLMTGPSGSADIGGITVHPAQGVKTLTVILKTDQQAN